jgi:NitT/TauT family transport system ATP-binding protein
MITHIIEEAVFLADRIIILGTRPGRIRETIANSVPHPREYQSPAFLSMVQRIHRVIVSEHLPDEPLVAARAGPTGIPTLEPVPPVAVGEVFGLMEIVHDHGGRMNVFQLDQLTRDDFGHTLAVVMAGEMLDFLETPREVVVLTDLGREFLAADINGRKDRFRGQVLKLDLFRHVLGMLEKVQDKQLPRETVEEELVLRFAVRADEAGRLFDTLVAWGRFGELFGFSPATEMLYLPQAPGRPA